VGVGGTAVTVVFGAKVTTGFPASSDLAVGVALGVGVDTSAAGKAGRTAVSADERPQPTKILPNKTAARTAVNFNLFDHMTWNCIAKK
jgi:hypothetical protein